MKGDKTIMIDYGNIIITILSTIITIIGKKLYNKINENTKNINNIQKIIINLNDSLNLIKLSITDLEKYIINEKTVDEIAQKMIQISNYYINKLPEEFRNPIILKATAFRNFIINFCFYLNFDNIDDYQKFHNELSSCSKIVHKQMKQILNNDTIDKFYQSHTYYIQDYDNQIRDIFFTTENNKKQKFLSTSIKFLENFLKNYTNIIFEEKIPYSSHK